MVSKRGCVGHRLRTFQRHRMAVGLCAVEESGRGGTGLWFGRDLGGLLVVQDDVWVPVGGFVHDMKVRRPTEAAGERRRKVRHGRSCGWGRERLVVGRVHGDGGPEVAA